MKEGGALQKHAYSGNAPARDMTFLGSMLFQRHVSGTRVIARSKTATIEGIVFSGYGAHYNSYPHDYLTMAAAIGTNRQDVDEFICRLRLCLKAFN